MPMTPTAPRPLAAIGRALTTMMENDSRLRTVRRLQQMTDTELAARGMTRDQIVARVYSPYMYL